jgi:hypothetical protein
MQGRTPSRCFPTPRLAVAAFAVATLALSVPVGSARAAEPIPLESKSGIDVAATAGECRRVDPGAPLSVWRLTAGPTDRPGTLGAETRFTPAGGKHWDLSAHQSVLIEVRNTGTVPVTVRASITNPGAANLARTCQTAATVLPGKSARLDLRIVPTPLDPGYDAFKPFFKYFTHIHVEDNTVDPADIDALTVWLDTPAEGSAVELSGLRLSGRGTTGRPAFFPFVDKYGQYVHADWPGKIHSDADFALRRAEEDQERAEWPGPADRNRFGGWAGGPQLPATGNFRVAKHEGQWWLVDPEGKLFWSYGPTGAGFGSERTPITDRENWFAELPPPRDGPLGKHYSEGRNVIYEYYRGRAWTGYEFHGANLERKYGPVATAATELTRITANRLRSWGFNTMGNWSSTVMMSSGLMPYVTAIHFGSPMVNDHLPDVFHPGWEQALRARIETERDTTAKDPMNIGYFVDNERRWGRFARGAGVALQVLEAAPTTASKARFIDDLKAKYGEIESLNRSWGTQHASWDALLQSRAKVTFADPANPDKSIKPALQADCDAFGEKFVERYFSVCRDAVKSVAPGHMYLGARLNGHIDASLIRLQTRYCDVISYNIYDAIPENRLRQYADIDFPFLITEWGIDNDPRQSPFRAAKPEVSVGTNIPRVKALTQYAESAIINPRVVGAHFFQYRDQPLSGRPDGEALLRGFINTTDTPNFELIRANRLIAYDLYAKRARAK